MNINNPEYATTTVRHRRPGAVELQAATRNIPTFSPPPPVLLCKSKKEREMVHVSTRVKLILFPVILVPLGGTATVSSNRQNHTNSSYFPPKSFLLLFLASPNGVCASRGTERKIPNHSPGTYNAKPKKKPLPSFPPALILSVLLPPA